MLVLLSTLALAAQPSAAGDGAGTVDLDFVGTFAIPGMPHVPIGVEPIINGTPYDKVDWPETGAMVVKLGLRYGTQVFEFITPICSSTLIAPDVVLLAAHCVDEKTLQYSLPGNAEIIEFAFDRKADLSSYQNGNPYNLGVVVASGTKKHPKFDINNFNSFSSLGVSKNDDIALLFLEEPVLEVDHAYLPTAEEVEQILEGNVVEIVGWGQRDAANPYTAGIKYGGVSDIGELGAHELQIGADASDVRKCHGDSGGPTFMAFETDSAVEHRVIGVTSHAYDLTDCASKGGVDTRVDAYLDWIEDEMVAACDEGLRTWCDWPGIVPPPDADGYHAWEVNPNDPVDPFGGVGDDEDEASSSSSEGSGGCSTVSGSVGLAGGLVGLVGLLGRRR